MPKYTQAEIADSTATLAAMLRPGATVYTRVLHVSRSGMMRVISAHVIHDGEPVDISLHVARVTGNGFDRDRWGVKMTGCGMDMTFAMVYSLGRHLWPNGFPCTGSNGWTPTGRRSRAPRCLANDHVNPGDRGYRKGRMHSDSGYALNRGTL